MSEAQEQTKTDESNPNAELVVVETMPGRKRRYVRLDDDAKRKVVAALSIGSSVATAAKVLGCSPNTIYVAMRRDPQFADDIRRAGGQRELVLLRRIDDASKIPANWRASAWLLACTNRERFGGRRPGDVSPEQMQQILLSVCEAIADEIRDADDRGRVMRRLHDISSSLQLPLRLKVES